MIATLVGSKKRPSHDLYEQAPQQVSTVDRHVHRHGFSVQRSLVPSSSTGDGPFFAWGGGPCWSQHPGQSRFASSAANVLCLGSDTCCGDRFRTTSFVHHLSGHRRALERIHAFTWRGRRSCESITWYLNVCKLAERKEMTRNTALPCHGKDGSQVSRTPWISMAPCLAILLILLFLIPLAFIFWDLTGCIDRTGVVKISRKVGAQKWVSPAGDRNTDVQTASTPRPVAISTCEDSSDKMECLDRLGVFSKQDQSGFACAGRTWSTLNDGERLSFSAADVKAGHLWKLENKEGHSFFYKVECRPTLHRIYHFGAHGYTDYFAFLLAEALDLDVAIPCTEFVKVPLRQLRNNTPIHRDCIFEDGDSGSPYTVGAMSSGLSSLRPMEWVSNEEVRFFATAESVPNSLKPYLEDVVKIGVLDYMVLNDDRHFGTYNTLFSVEFSRPVFMDAGAFARLGEDICSNHTELLTCPSILRDTSSKCAKYNKATASFCLLSETLLRKVLSTQPADFVKHLQKRLEENVAWQAFLQIGGTQRAPTFDKLLARKAGRCAPSQTIKDTGDVTGLLLEGAVERLSLLKSHLRSCVSKEELPYVLQLDS